MQAEIADAANFEEIFFLTNHRLPTNAERPPRPVHKRKRRRGEAPEETAIDVETLVAGKEDSSGKRRRIVPPPRASVAPANEEEAQEQARLQALSFDQAQIQAASGGDQQMLEKVEMQQQSEEEEEEEEEDEDEEEEDEDEDEEEEEQQEEVLEEGHVQGINYEESQFDEEGDDSAIPSELLEYFGGIFLEESTAGDDTPGIDDI